MTTRARDLVALVNGDVAETARRWLAATGTFPTGVDWAEFLVLALRHRLIGIAQDTLSTLDWLDRIPVTIYDQLIHWSEIAELRQRELEQALAELAAAVPDAVSRTVLLKGAALRTEYAKPSHRLMSDFDLLFSEDDFAEVEPHFEKLGYWRKESLNGPTYYREAGRSGRLCLDAHVAGPSKYHRPECALDETWLHSSVPFEVAGTACRRMAPDHAFVNVVSHIHEHLGSWIHALADDDVRLIRVIDAELMLTHQDVDVVGSWRLAGQLDLHGEFALGLWAWAQLRGGLPVALAPLAPAVELVSGVGELAALPGGALGRWTVPLRDRGYLIDRTELAFDLLPAGSVRRWQHWQGWYMREGMLPDKREAVERIAEQARERLTGFAPATA